MIMLICFENSFCIHISIYVNITKSEGHIVVFDCLLFDVVYNEIYWVVVCIHYIIKVFIERLGFASLKDIVVDYYVNKLDRDNCIKIASRTLYIQNNSEK